MESRSSKVKWMVGLGGLLGGLLAVWLAPKVIVWYFDPPAQFGFNCKAPIEWALGRLQMAQLVGVIVGAVTAPTLYLLVRRKVTV